MEFPLLYPKTAPLWLTEHTTIRYTLDVVPDPMSPFFTQIHTLDEEIQYNISCSLLKPEAVSITPLNAAFYHYCMDSRIHSDMFIETEIALGSDSSSQKQRVLTPDTLFFTHSSYVDVTNPSHFGLVPRQIVMVAEDKQDDTFFNGDSVSQVFLYLHTVLANQPGRLFLYGIMLSPSYVRFLRLERAPVPAETKQICSYYFFVTPTLMTHKGGLLYLYKFLQQPLAFYGISTIVDTPPTVSDVKHKVTPSYLSPSL